MNKLSLEYYIKLLKGAKTYLEYIEIMNKIYSFHRSKSFAVIQKLMKGEFVDAAKIQNDHIVDCVKSTMTIN